MRAWLFSLSVMPPAGIIILGPSGWCSQVSLQQMPPGLRGQLSILASERASDTTARSMSLVRGHRRVTPGDPAACPCSWRGIGDSLLPIAKAGGIRLALLHSSPSPVDGNVILHMGSALT